MVQEEKSQSGQSESHLSPGPAGILVLSAMGKTDFESMMEQVDHFRACPQLGWQERCLQLRASQKPH